MNPQYPVFIVSKGRWVNAITDRALDRMGVPYRVIVESEEKDLYAQKVGEERLLVLPRSYLEEYDTCDHFGCEKSKGPGAARNFAWDVAISEGHKRHWVLDDNLDDFHRLHKNLKCPVRTGAIFKAAEDFVDRYDNVPVAGFNYHNFCKETDKIPPYTQNTRIYSCLLIENSTPYRWRGRYNEDTDLCLRVLKDGLCTIQFNAFLAGKVTTQRMRGGNTKEFYQSEGTLEKSKMLAKLHPDVASVVWRFNRWHHHVDYRPFKKNALKRLPGFEELPNENNEYGMKLIEIDKTDKYEEVQNRRGNGNNLY